MATFNYVLGRKKDNGTYPVYLKIRHLNTNTMRSMDMSVAKSEWNSRGQEVAKILGVEVAELFKPTSTGKTVSGYLEYDGRIVKVDSLDAVKRFIAEVEVE